jgi:glycine cleavage system transcriptional repressor
MHLSVSAIGADRPGIVAAVTKVLTDLGANIEDSRMALLGGHFSMMLVVSTQDEAAAAALEQALAGPARDLDLLLSVRPLAEVPPEHAQGTDHVVRVYGTDRPGIVAEISAALAEQNVNIRDLATHMVGGEPPVYVMVLEVTLPSGTTGADVEAALDRVGTDLGVQISLEPFEPETL